MLYVNINIWRFVIKLDLLADTSLCIENYQPASSVMLPGEESDQNGFNINGFMGHYYLNKLLSFLDWRTAVLNYLATAQKYK